MPPRKKAVLVVGAVIAGVMAVIYVISLTIFLAGYAALEQLDTRTNVQRVLDAFQDNLAKVDFTTGDWAGWDDTYAYIKSGDKHYEEANLNDGAIGPKGIAMNVIMYVRPSGQILFGTGYDLVNDRRVVLPDGIKPHGTLESALLHHTSAESKISGIFLLPEGPLLIASRPILTSEKKGPIRGTLIFGRYLDAAAVRRLSGITHIPLTVHRFDEAMLPPDFQAVRAAYTGQESIFVRPLSSRTIGGYAVLPDIHGRPALLLLAEMPRAIYQHGRTTLQYFLLALMLFGVGLGGATIVLVDRLILSRLARRESEERFRELFEDAHDIVFTTDPRGYVTSFNSAGERTTGYSREEIRNLDVSRIIAPEYQELARQMLTGALPDEGSSAYELELLTKDGQRIPVEVSVRLKFRDGTLVGMQGIARDISERKRAEAERKRAEIALRDSEERYALAARGANDGLWDWDLRADRIYFSPRWKSMLGYAETEVGSDSDEWFSRVHSDDLAQLKAELNAHLEGGTPHFESEYRVWHKDGSYRWMLCRGLAVRDAFDHALRIAGSQTDITERKVAEQQLLHDAFHDGLTGLPNRALFVDRLEQTIRRAQRHPDDKFAVLFLDLDRFKIVNDSLGHLAGDQLLREIGRRLELSLRASDTVARLGGDEFAILLDETREFADVELVAERILGTLATPFKLNGDEVCVTGSIGVALHDPASKRPEEYLRDADAAMYRAKELGKARYAVFSPDMHARALTVLRMQSELRRAIEQREFRLHYQPIVSLHTGTVIGLEALIRWAHPQRGLVPPAEFIPLAEETGLIVGIGDWVFREAVGQVRAWLPHLEGHRRRTISVNLSRRQLSQPDLMEQMRHVLDETRIDPRQMQLEITESVIMENVEAASAVMTRLRSLGLELSVDDFGTGYSSLSTLQRFPITTLKIDRVFTRGITSSDENAEIIRAVVMLAHNLGIKVVAEGVETAEELALLRSVGCEYAQGFFFSRPVEAADAVRFLGKQIGWRSALQSVVAKAE